MKASLILFLILYPGLSFAKSYDRPIPQAQSATAEIWFLIASLALIGALFVVQFLVNRR
jgi:hypothetical protein